MTATAPVAAATPRRVVALIDAAKVGGPGRQLRALATALRAHGVELHVVLFRRDGTPAPPYAAFLADAGVPHHVLDEAGPLDWRSIGRVSALLRQLDPDVVQTHSYKTTAIMYALRRLGATWPWIAFFHGATAEDRKVRAYHWLDRRLMPSADRLVVMSEAHRAAFARHGSRVRVVHNAVISTAPDAPPRAHAGDASAAAAGPVLGVVGRLSHEKGVDVFLEALARLVAPDKPGSPGSPGPLTPRALVAGDGPDRRDLERRVADLGIASRVEFLGNVDDVGAVYAALDLLVIPSRSEGLPNVLLEALRADVPAVATAVGAVPEVLCVDGAGIVVPPGDPAALADGIRRGLALAADPSTAAARRAVVDRFSLARRVESHVTLYREVVAERAAHGATRAA